MNLGLTRRLYGGLLSLPSLSIQISFLGVYGTSNHVLDFFDCVRLDAHFTPTFHSIQLHH
jgi:hypothetical protein